MTSSQQPIGQFHPILVGYMLGGQGFRFVQISGWRLLGPYTVQNLEHFDISSTIFFSCTTGRNALIFDMEHHWGKDIQVQMKFLGSQIATP